MKKPYDHERLILAAWAAAESCQPSGKVNLRAAVEAALAAADQHDEAMGIQRLTRTEVAAIKAQAWLEGYSDSWWQERGYGLDGLQDYPAPDFLAEELVEWNRYSVEDA